MLLEDRFSEFIETCRGQSECNRRNYRQRLSGFLAVHGAKPASACTPADVNTWHRELQKRGLAPATLAGYRQALKAFFNYCVQVGDIPRSPAAHLTIGSFQPAGGINCLMSLTSRRLRLWRVSGVVPISPSACAMASSGY